MTLEDRLNRLARRTPPGDPAHVMAAARTRAESLPDARSPRYLAAAAAVVAVLALAVGGLALTGGEDNESVTVAGPDRSPAEPVTTEPVTTEPQPSCEDITQFADSLDDTGIVYDYDASTSPQDLASRSDVVFAGTLTGTVTASTDEEYGIDDEEYGVDYVGFEVEVADHFKIDDEPVSDTVTVLLEYAMQRPTDQWAELVAPGAPVVVFAHLPAGSIPGQGTSVVANPVEGIVTACEGGPPLGLVGGRGEWPSFRTLADITATLASTPDEGEATGGDSDPDEGAGLSDEDAATITNAFLRLAEEPSAEAVEQLPFAEEVRLGLGSELHQARSRSQLADPAAWVIDAELFRAYTGPFSALEVAAGANSTVVSIGEHPHCASPPVAPPDAVADLTRVSVQPDLDEMDSCLQWWTVDLFVNDAGQIEAVTLDLWEP